ncbi:hypothetical protein BATDEDRAFT_2594, partial [Batrachochytrium dendrobatidis JAM81]
IVDSHASIWLHQFLKAMRSRDGNLLHGAHIIGFFRRICKLLFYGILPVFVFDGATPALKRQTIASRRHRRATVEQSLRKTAERILSLQLQKRALIVNWQQRKSCVPLLLFIFGIPYIVATTEAESQCAFLQKQGLVEGIVTDDSDVFVFGGEVVYKNMFTQTRSVEIYTMDRLQEQLGLSREKLILLAYLLGSDYTPGLVGIGPVTSVEILNEWCNLDYSKGGRNLAKKLDIPDGFPDLRVLNAYINPVVDQDLTNFTWGEPDLEGIRHFLEHKLQWSHETVDQ